MNLHPPNTKVQTYVKRLLIGTKEVSEASIRKAADEAVDANEGVNDIADF